MSDGRILGLADGATDPLTLSLVRAIVETAAELGMDSRSVATTDDEVGVDTLLSVGLPQYYDRVLAGPRVARRIAWFGEPLPRPTPGGAAGRAAHRLREPALRVLRSPARRLRRMWLPERLAALRAASYAESERHENLAAALRRAATVDRLVVTSRDRASILATYGVAARTVPFGYHPALAGPIVREAAGRDIAAVAFGSGLDWSSRRARGLRRCAERLGPGRLVVSGTAWGPDRDRLLRRSRVVLDVHRVPGNFIGLRILLAAAAGAVLVTEPMDEPAPFEPGRHHLEATLDDLPAAVDELLADEPRRRRMVAAGQALLTGPLTMAASLQAVLA